MAGGSQSSRASCIMRSGRPYLGSLSRPPRQMRSRFASGSGGSTKLLITSSLSLKSVQLIPATTHWGVFGALSVAGAIGIWSERTRVGKELSGPIISTLVGLLLSNTGIIPCEAPAVYGLINKFLLPLAVPLLLFTADLRRMLTDTGRLLLIFCAGSVATVIGTLTAFKLLPLTSLGPDGWKVASALAARHIGGAVNYVGVAETLGISGTAQAAGLAADNLLCAAYFATLFSLARQIPADPAETVQAEAKQQQQVPAVLKNASWTMPCQEEAKSQAGASRKGEITVSEGATAVAVSCVVCYLGSQCAAALGLPDAGIPIITLLSVLLATLFPKQLAPLVASGEGIAAILLSLFFAGVGANGNIAQVLKSAPALFAFCLIQIGVHLALILAAGKLMGFSRRDVLIASNANVGGPTTAAGMCAAKGWRTSVVPALLIGTFGYAAATFLGVALGVGVLRKM